MMDGSAFGAAFNKEVMDRLMDEPDEDIPEQTPEPEPEPALDETPTPEPEPEEEEAEPEPEPIAVEEEAPEEAPEETEEAPQELILGRYKTTDELVNAYQEIRGLQQNTAEAMREREAEIEEMKALLRQAAEALQTQQPQAPDPALVQWAEQNGLDPQSLPVLQALADQAAQVRLAPMQEQMEKAQAEAAQQAEYQAQVGAVQSFRSAHPDIEPGSPEDERHAEVFKALREDPQILLQFNADTLEIALEASQDPAFYSIIRANPGLIDTDEGLEYARWQATLKKGTQTAQTQALKKQSKAQRTAAARKAHVETGGAPPAQSPDEEDVVDIAFNLPKRDSAFF